VVAWAILVTLPRVARADGPEPTPEVTARTPTGEWVPGRAAVELTTPMVDPDAGDGWVVVVTGRALLGTRAVSYTTAPSWIDAGATTEVPVELPREVFLDELAVDFVTRLSATVWLSRQEGGAASRLDLPDRFLLWTGGADAEPEVLSAEERDLVAPCGTTRVTAAPAGFGDRTVRCSLLPPMPDVEAPRDDSPPRLRLLTEVDDQSDEVSP
jgi:hypothetical protein